MGVYNYQPLDKSIKVYCEELNVKTPFNVVVKWQVLDETIFKEKLEKFKQKVLYLKCISKQGEMGQPCET